MAETSARVLVVDDEADTRNLLRLRLGNEGYEVGLAGDGWDALEQIAQELPDLVITDLMMPRVDGVALIKRLRGAADTASLPIILLSGRDRAVDLAFGLEAGADDYVAKPFDYAELSARVKSLLRRVRGTFAEQADPAARGHVAALLGAKGGVGTTTIAANVGVALARAGTATILVDLRPVRGTIAALLGIAPRRRLDRLPLTRPEVLTKTMIEDTLLPHPSGLRVLLGPSGEQETPPADGVKALIEGLRRLAGVVLADIDGSDDVFGQATLKVAEQVWVVTEPEPTSVDRAETMVKLLEQRGVRPRVIHVLANQTSPTMTLGVAEIAARVGRPVAHAIGAVPQACAEAVRRGTPLVDLGPDLPSVKALTALAETIATKRPPITGSLPDHEPAPASAARAALKSAVERQQSG